MRNFDNIPRERGFLAKCLGPAVILSLGVVGWAVVSSKNINIDYPINFDGKGNIAYRDFRCKPVRQRSIPFRGVDALVNAANNHKFGSSRLQRLRPLANTLQEIASNRGYDSLFKFKGKIKPINKPYRPLAEKTYTAPECEVIKN